MVKNGLNWMLCQNCHRGSKYLELRGMHTKYICAGEGISEVKELFYTFIVLVII